LAKEALALCKNNQKDKAKQLYMEMEKLSKEISEKIDILKRECQK